MGTFLKNKIFTIFNYRFPATVNRDFYGHDTKCHDFYWYGPSKVSFFFGLLVVRPQIAAHSRCIGGCRRAWTTLLTSNPLLGGSKCLLHRPLKIRSERLGEVRVPRHRFVDRHHDTGVVQRPLSCSAEPREGPCHVVDQRFLQANADRFLQAEPTHVF